MARRGAGRSCSAERIGPRENQSASNLATARYVYSFPKRLQRLSSNVFLETVSSRAAPATPGYCCVLCGAPFKAVINIQGSFTHPWIPKFLPGIYFSFFSRLRNFNLSVA